MLEFVATRPGTRRQRGHRSARQPRISGRAARTRDLMIIVTQSGTKVLQKGFTRPSWGTTCPTKHDTDQSIFGSGSLNLEAEVLIWAAAWSGSLHRLWLGYWFLASSLVLSSFLTRRYIPFRTWLHKKPV